VTDSYRCKQFLVLVAHVYSFRSIMAQKGRLETNFLYLYLKMCQYFGVSLLIFEKTSGKLLLQTSALYITIHKFHLLLASIFTAASIVQAVHFHLKSSIDSSLETAIMLQVTFFVSNHVLFCVQSKIHLKYGKDMRNLFNCLVDFENKNGNNPLRFNSFMN